MNNSEILCPRCGRDTIYRLHRSLIEKLRSRKKKYLCGICKTVFFRGSGEAEQHARFEHGVR